VARGHRIDGVLTTGLLLSARGLALGLGRTRVSTTGTFEARLDLGPAKLVSACADVVLADRCAGERPAKQPADLADVVEEILDEVAEIFT
jgi:hypothetical protein